MNSHPHLRPSYKTDADVISKVGGAEPLYGARRTAEPCDEVLIFMVAVQCYVMEGMGL